MAIINGTRASTKEKLKIEINAEILENIKAYCKWSNIDNIDYFLEEAAIFVFSKDRDWKEHQKAVRRAKKMQSAE